MIQRIQTIFLFIITLVMSGSIFLPLWGEVNDTEKTRTELSAIEMVHSKAASPVQTDSTVYVAALAGVIALLALWNIFNFNKRIFQMKVGFLITLLICVFIALSSWLVHSYDSLIPKETNAAFGMGFFMPLVAIVMSQLAIRFINRDEKMVRSADRLR